MIDPATAVLFRGDNYPHLLAQAAVDTLTLAVSRYCPITLFGCGTGLDAAETRWAGIPLLLVVVVQSLPGGPFRAGTEARRLARAGVDAVGLGYDRHLTAGVEISLGLLSRRRLDAADLAAGVLARATGGTA